MREVATLKILIFVQVCSQSDCVWTQAGASRPDRVCRGGPPQGQVEQLRQEGVLHPDGNIFSFLWNE